MCSGLLGCNSNRGLENEPRKGELKNIIVFASLFKQWQIDIYYDRGRGGSRTCVSLPFVEMGTVWFPISVPKLNLTAD